MHIYYLTIEQINKNILTTTIRKKNLSTFYLKKTNNDFIINQTQKLHRIKKSIQKIQEKKLSILRSPHVFKKAQEHFKRTSFIKKPYLNMTKDSY